MSRIKELVVEATNECDRTCIGFEPGDYNAVWEQLFAELIIKECLKEVMDEVQYQSGWEVAETVVDRVNAHFDL